MKTKAMIFPGDNRVFSQSNGLQSRKIIQQQTDAFPFGKLSQLEDDVLEPGGSLQFALEEDVLIMLLPVVGAIRYEASTGHPGLLAAGQVQFLPLGQGATLQVSNPFDDLPVNFLQVWFRASWEQAPQEPAISEFNVNTFMNCTLRISPGFIGWDPLPFSASIGKFSGRGETVYYPSGTDAGLFVFVLEGAFEVEGRLLHPRDGLALVDPQQVEMEALSNEALILVLEQPALAV